MWEKRESLAANDKDFSASLEMTVRGMTASSSLKAGSSI